MASLREIRRKIRSIKSVTQVTRTMKLVSSVKFAKAQTAIMNSKPFSEGIEEMIRRLARGSDHPFFEEDREGKKAMLLITADRGLCGSFNNNLIRKCMEFVSARSTESFVFYAAGRKGRDFFIRQGIKIENEYAGIFRKLGFSAAEVIAGDLIEKFLARKISEIWVTYGEFKKAGMHRDTVTRILPIEHISKPAGQRPVGLHSDIEYLFEPARETLLGQLLLRYFKVKIFKILLESSASEHLARMNAMDMATDNANGLIDELILNLNKQRQMGITKELSEIVGAAEAL